MPAQEWLSLPCLASPVQPESSDTKGNDALTSDLAGSRCERRPAPVSMENPCFKGSKVGASMALTILTDVPVYMSK